MLSLNFRAGDNLIHEHYERFHVMRMLQHVGGMWTSIGFIIGFFRGKRKGFQEPHL